MVDEVDSNIIYVIARENITWVRKLTIPTE